MPGLPQPLLRIPVKDELKPIQKRLIAERQALIEKIMASVNIEEATFDNVYAPMLRFENESENETNMNMTLGFASLDADLQSETEAASNLWSAHGNWVQKQDKFIQLTMAAGEKTDGIDPESKRRLENRVKYLKRLGHGSLDEQTRKAYLDTRTKISNLCQQVNRNIRLYDGGHFAFTDEELDGLEQQDLEKYKKDDSGKRLVPLNRAEYDKIMASVSKSDTRKTFYDAWTARLPENVPLFREIILLRDENARRIGYRNDANLCLDGRMAKSTEWVEELLADLRSHLKEPGRKIFAELEEIKAKLLAENSDSVVNKEDAVVQDWDLPYLKKIEAKENKIDQNAISAYLPFKETTAAIIRNITRYLQLRLEPVAKEDLVGCIWSDDIDVWAVWDEGEEETGQFVGYFYGDLLDRPNKYKHNQTVELQASFLREDGSRPYPAAILMCSFSPDIVDGCKVLTHSNIITMYHGK